MVFFRPDDGLGIARVNTASSSSPDLDYNSETPVCHLPPCTVCIINIAK